MTPQILRTGARVAEKRGNPICADQMRAAADEIERLRMIEADAAFLIGRLSAFELTDDAKEMTREYLGHVAPAEERLRARVAKSA